jgi:O-antigen/teichoic acid export membrane protein
LTSPHSFIICINNPWLFVKEYTWQPNNSTTCFECFIKNHPNAPIILAHSQPYNETIKMMSKYPSLAMLGGYAIVSVYKICLLITEQSVFWFAVSHAIEAMVAGIALILIYQRKSDLKIGISWSLMKALFSRSKYYILSAMMVTIFSNTDHIMLTLMVGKAENGIYSAAITSANVFNFVYAAIIDAARPAILSGKYEDQATYEKSVSGLYSVIMYLALAQSLCFSLLAKPILLVLYGKDYISAVPVLQIAAWMVAFSYAGTVRNIWILAEGKHSLLWMINLSGALLNIALNALLIPVLGAIGAASATVATQVFTNVIVSFIFKPIWTNNKLLINGMRFNFFKEIVWELLNSRKS